MWPARDPLYKLDNRLTNFTTFLVSSKPYRKSFDNLGRDGTYELTVFRKNQICVIRIRQIRRIPYSRYL